MSYKLGKKIGVVVDSRTLNFAAFLDHATLPAPPGSTELARGVSVPMFGNDDYGDCCFASHGHRIVMQQHRAYQHDAPDLTDKDILKAYSDVTGFDPDDPSTDNGAYLIDVLRYARNTGFGRETDGTRHMIGAYVKVSPSNHAHVRLAAWMFGGLYCGVNLPRDASDQISEDRVWTVTGGSDGEPGSWGGHAMWLDGYSGLRVGFRTWAQRQRASWAWWDKYVDEAWAVITEDYFKKSGLTAEGFNLSQLQDALSRL